MKKLNVKLIFGIAMGIIVLTIGIHTINRYLKTRRYEVIEPSISSGSKEQLNSVVEVITKSANQSEQSVNSNQERAYVVVTDKNINHEDISEIIKMGTKLGIKINFLDSKIVSANKEIQSAGNKIIPEGVDLERIAKEERIEMVNLDEFYSFKSTDTRSLVIFVEDVKKLENSKAEFDKKIDNLKAEGYTFKVFA